LRRRNRKPPIRLVSSYQRRVAQIFSGFQSPDDPRSEGEPWLYHAEAGNQVGLEKPNRQNATAAQGKMDIEEFLIAFAPWPG